MNTIVSILVPIYNSEKYLRQCLNSIVNQTYKSLEIILINDGSTDNSQSIIDEYSERDSRIRVYYQKNCGVAETRNQLLEHATGDFILFVDSDDWIELNTINLIMQEQSNGNYEMVTFSMSDSKSDIDCVYSQEQAIKEFLKHISFNGSLCNKVIKRCLFTGLSFNPEISYGEDALMTWQVLQKLSKVRFTSLPLYHYRMNECSISHHFFDQKKMSGHKVWETITNDTKILWPQFYDIAKARFVTEDMWQLYFAAKSDYPKDDYIKNVQEHVRNNFSLLKQSRLIDNKKLIFAWVISHCYSIKKVLKFILK